jgi:outer membrane immunogenic protein
MPKWILLVAVTALVIGPAIPATQASPPTAALPAREASAVAQWTGPFLGLGLGGRWIDTEWQTECLAATALPRDCPNDIFQGRTRIGNDNPVDFGDSAFRLNAFFGYDQQIARMVIGVEGDVGVANGGERRKAIPGTWSDDLGADDDSSKVRGTWDASLRARLGFLVAPAVLIYSTGGLAVLNQDVSASCAGFYPAGWCLTPHSETINQTFVGWTVGGGAEWMFADNWSVRGEYRYSEYGKEPLTFFADAPLDSLRAGLRSAQSVGYMGISRRF